MNLKYGRIRQIKHLAIDFHVEYDADAFNELRMNPLTDLPEFYPVGEADTGLKRLYFTHTDDDGMCDQFHIDNVSDALATVEAVAEIYRTINYKPSELIRCFEAVTGEEIKLLSLLNSDFHIAVVGPQTGDVRCDAQLGAVYTTLQGNMDWVDVHLTYKKSANVRLDLKLEELHHNEVVSQLIEVAEKYSQLIDTPLEMEKYF